MSARRWALGASYAVSAGWVLVAAALTSSALSASTFSLVTLLGVGERLVDVVAQRSSKIATMPELLSGRVSSTSALIVGLLAVRQQRAAPAPTPAPTDGAREQGGREDQAR